MIDAIGYDHRRAVGPEHGLAVAWRNERKVLRFLYELLFEPTHLPAPCPKERPVPVWCILHLRVDAHRGGVTKIDDDGQVQVFDDRIQMFAMKEDDVERLGAQEQVHGTLHFFNGTLHFHFVVDASAQQTRQLACAARSGSAVCTEGHDTVRIESDLLECLCGHG